MGYLARYSVLLICCEALAQSLLPGVGPRQSLRLSIADYSVLELQEPRHDFRCSVMPLKPQLGFDFIFHTGYRVIFSMKEFGAEENVLTTLFRVTPLMHPDEPVYFSEKIRLPAAQDDRGGDATLTGGFLVGTGKYHIDWLMRDRGERFCAGFWDVDARLSAKESTLVRAVANDIIQAAQPDPFADEPRAAGKSGSRLLAVKVIVDFSPRSAAAAAPNPEDVDALSAILRRISRESRIGAYSMVACSLQDQRVFYRHETDHQIDLPALGKALTPVTFATVGINDLARKNGREEFLGNLIVDELRNDRPDAVIIVGYNSEAEVKKPQNIANQLQNVPVFYLNYRAARYTWSDNAIGRMVKQLRGHEYVISQPRDLFEAWSDLIERIDAGLGR